MTAALLALDWQPIDTWLVAVAAVSAASCAILGVFLLLRRMSMMGDAISHAVLPGLAAAFLLTESRDSFTMLIGAAVIGVLTAFFTEWVRRNGRVDEGASMGVVFTVLFAIGLVLIRRAANAVDLDVDCVLYGALETTPLDLVPVLGVDLPRALLIGGVSLLLNVAFVTLLFKELRISSFDPDLATALGFPAAVMHYALMTLVAITTVAAFQSVGSILVIAMLIVPAAAAHLLTDRLSLLVVLAALLSVAAAALGHWAALVTPGWFGYTGTSVNTAGMIGVVTGLIFVAAALAGPRHGIVSRFLHRAALSRRIAEQDLLGLLFRLEEKEAGSAAVSPAAARSSIAAGGLTARLAIASLIRGRRLERGADGLRLTEIGRSEARELIRSHRLWEVYLEQHTAVGPDHVHGTAERLEHVTSAEMRARLARVLGSPAADPHGKDIPQEPEEPPRAP